MKPANALLIDTYARVAESVPAVVGGLDRDQLAWRPEGDGNSIGWLVWHLTRVLDDHLAAAFEREQVWLTGGFARRAALPLNDREHGYGHTSEQVDSVRLDGDLLAEYHQACQAAFADALAGVDDWDRIVDEQWDPPVTLAVRLVSVGDDMARHIGQAQYVRGLLDQRS